MSLDDFVQDKRDGTKESTTSTGGDKPTGVKDFSRVKFQKDKLHKTNLCPDCGKAKTEEFQYYWRCNNDNCDTLTYFSPDYKVSL